MARRTTALLGLMLSAAALVPSTTLEAAMGNHGCGACFIARERRDRLLKAEE